MLSTIKQAMELGITQKQACRIIGISTRKFRRWNISKPVIARTAWNKITPEEKQAITDSAYDPKLIDKPISHLFVHGHDSDKFYASLSTVYKVLSEQSIVRKKHNNCHRNNYIDAHKLLEKGFHLLCYDATRFVTETNIAVWAMPVILLPSRYLLHIGYSLSSVTSEDLIRAVSEAYLSIPEHLLEKLMVHTDRGSAMKSGRTKRFIKKLIGLPVHYGRPHTPDDESWIEAFIKTLKYHRDIPSKFPLVDDVAQWFTKFQDIYNNDPHSALSYVTPLQALSGQMELILNQRKNNLLVARNNRLMQYKNKMRKNFYSVASMATKEISCSV